MFSAAATGDGSRRTPRSPGFLNHERSERRKEFADRKTSIEIKEILRTTSPPEHILQHGLQRASAPILSRTDLGRQRHIFDRVTRPKSGSSGSLKKLLRRSRSAASSSLTKEVTVQETATGRKYLKIEIDRKNMYEFENQSVYEVNCKRAKRQGHLNKSKNEEADSELIPPKLSGETFGDSLANGEKYPRPLSARLQSFTGNRNMPPRSEAIADKSEGGCSPSKRTLPVLELDPNIHEIAAATLSLAQTRAQIQASPKIKEADSSVNCMSQKRDSPHRSQWHHAAGKPSIFRGPYPVPTKFQMRPKRCSHPNPKTPRSSLETATALPETSPITHGRSKPSSTISADDSNVDDNQSDAYSGEIMSAQSAEYVQGQGNFGICNGVTRKALPKPGPAPTRALPSLPEGRDTSTPRPDEQDKKDQGQLLPRQSLESSPTKLPPRSPAQMHRYRLSPVKIKMAKALQAPASLKPNPEFIEEFPRPPKPSSSGKNPHGPVSPGEPSTPQYYPASTMVQHRQCDKAGMIRSRSVEALDLQQSGAGIRNSKTMTDCVDFAQGKTDQSSDSIGGPASLWHGSRSQRVKSLRFRDMERLRSQKDGNLSELQSNLSIDPNAQDKRDPTPPISTAGLCPPSHQLQLSHLSTTSTSPSEQRHSASAMNLKLSPVVLVAEQEPQSPLLDDIQHRICPVPFPPSTASSPKGVVQLAQTPKKTRDQIAPPATARLSCQDRLFMEPEPGDKELRDRIAALERKNLLLEKAFMAVMDASRSL
ncbi:MAG: hypothetical protein Q9190_008066 [Brigantiaea leucoxantha]